MLQRFLEVLERSREGERAEEKEWKYEIVPETVKDILNEYDLKDTYDPENPVNTDLSLADRYWEAGFELARRLGMYCPDTERRVKFSERELKDAISNAAEEIPLGLGKDRIKIEKRKPESTKEPKADMSALGLEVTEENFIPLSQSIVQNEIIDSTHAPTFKSVLGYEVRARAPEETLLGMYEAKQIHEALRRAGRPGMPVFGVEGASTEYGHFGGLCPGGFNPEQSAAIALFPEPAMLPYHIMHRVAQGINGGYPIHPGHMGSIRGYFGSTEGVALSSIACQILQKTVVPVQSILIESSILDARNYANAGRDTLWAKSVSYQARSRNSPILDIGFVSNVNGPNTDMLLYESAAIAITDSVSGIPYEIGTRPAACRYPNHGSSLENKFTAEVLKAASELSLENANHIVKTLIDSVPNYEDKLRNPSKGDSFRECMNTKTLRPKDDWFEKYERIWNELEDWGLPRKY